MFDLNKKSMSGIAIAMVALGASWGASAASESASVSVTATVVDNTCTPQWSAAGVTVDMGRVSSNDFGADKIGAAETFIMSLVNCGSDTSKVTVTATGEEDSVDSSLFANSVADGATGVAVGLWGGPDFSTQLVPNGSISIEYPVVNQSIDMNFKAGLMQTGANAPGAGAVKSVINLTMDYE